MIVSLLCTATSLLATFFYSFEHVAQEQAQSGTAHYLQNILLSSRTRCMQYARTGHRMLLRRSTCCACCVLLLYPRKQGREAPPPSPGSPRTAFNRNRRQAIRRTQLFRVILNGSRDGQPGELNRLFANAHSSFQSPGLPGERGG